MQDPYLQEATASEPLTEDEEYEMQKSWAEDPKKCTFIVLDAEVVGYRRPATCLDAMAGDVNLFLNDPDDASTAEIEVMIAEEKCRRKGLAREALRLLMLYAVRTLRLRRFVAKIGEGNVASLKLFQYLGYVEVSRSQAFREITLEYRVGQEEEKLLASQTTGMQTSMYD
ncbi:Acyl-CoA N-acyltransferase domain-containing protein [Klebsormidium nitens]|uniref:Acyl-CoA N-acyltransferase domain-containing protein n=1 Tax=Klebsormidium nitens TaxID=105231 RepID=A0A1Y1IJL2_KLENI|nr:Acyl-CoA N-acyltransferase domain-containing protein [Klebsormidium nitens]|eukprot:GAQ91060.1 Acyl-CoA N-acyltransferase domain-containing protein [Klebsormidium nitens]